MTIKRRFRVSLSGATVATASWATAVTLSGAAEVAAQPPQSGQAITQSASDQIQKLLEEKATRSPAQRKIGSNLLLDPAAPRGRAMHGAVPQVRSGVEVDAAGATVVDIKGEVTDQLLARIEEVGGEVISSFPQHQAVRARLPLDRLEEVAELDEVRSIRAAIEPELHQVNVSEGDTAHRAAEARSAFGVDGTGVQIGVISDSVDALASLQASGDLPAVTVLPGQDGVPGTSEGTAMLEIVHDLAPGADLLFATANGGEARFAQNILDLRAAGADVIVDDVSYFTEPVFQDGIVAQAVELVIADGAQYYSSAGNSGNLNDGTSGVWEGDFAPLAAAPSLHDFGSGFGFNPITADTQSFFTLQWSDAFGASGNDYDLFLLDPSLSQIIAFSNDIQDGNDFPFEIIDTRQRDDTGNNLVIIQQSGASARYLHLNANRGRLALATSGQTSGHSASAGAFSVAAVNVATAFGGPFVGGPANPVEPFSSDGPRQIFYDRDGRPITPGNLLAGGGFVRQKPDLAAADGVSTATPGFLPFFGTSAAAPHAAAIGALALSLVPTLTEEQIRQLYRGVALDIEGVGVDRDSGVGIVSAFPALAALAGLTQVAVDIRPQQCPNRVRVDTWGTLSVAIAGTDGLDVRAISPSSIRLAGAAPTDFSFSDVVTPFEPFVGKGAARDCTGEGPDGIEDLLLRFGDRALGPASERKVVVVPLTGELEDGTPIHGEDVLMGVAPRGSAGPSQDGGPIHESAVDPAVISDLLDRE
jgi:hypothetical protein